MNRPRSTASLWWKLFAGFVIASVVALDPLTGIIVSGPNVARAQDAKATTPVNQGMGFTAPGACAYPACAVPVVDVGPGLEYAFKKDFGVQLRFGLMLAALDALTLFSQTIAYDTAEWVASGFQGQAPGFFTDPFGEYTQNLVLDATGEFMGSFSENFTEGAFGIDLCKPPLFPELSLDLALGFPDINLSRVGRPRPKCSWTDIVANYGDTYQSLSNLDISKNINASFSTGGNDFSFGIGAHLGFFDKVAGTKNAGILSRLEGGGFKPVQDFISGNIQTPSQMAKANVEEQMIRAPTDAKNKNDSIKLNAAFQAGIEQMGLVAASTFTNVLLSRLLDKVKALLKPDPSRSRHVLPDLENPFAAGLGATKPKELFASQYSDLLTPRVTRQEDADILGELSACPSDVRGRWHCSMDEAFALAIRQGALTVRQAIDQGFINANWQLVPSTRLKDNQDPTCRNRAFCAANLRKMRLARIIPIGWELAADSSANQQSCTKSQGCITLGDAIRKFDDCNDEGKLDQDHPYCHLVDPNWVLTIFPAQCLTKGFSNVLFPAGGRMDECQDTALCLERDAAGKCVGGFGYCMAEQTFWQFEAPKCEEQFASCRTFQPRGQAAKPVSYVRATIDYGSCNESNVGCMWYAAKRLPDKADDASAWDNGYASTTDRVYFDKTMQTCDAKSDGCTSLRKVVPGKPALNLVQNGSFESTTGTPSVPEAWTNKSDDEWEYAAPTVVTGTAAVHGSQALVLPESDKLVQDVLGVRPLHTYTLSFYARRYINTPDGASVYVVPHDEDGDTITKGSGDPTYFKSIGCNLGSMEPYVTGMAITSEFAPFGLLGDEWTRYVCTFVTPKDTASLQLKVEGGTTDEKSPLIDAVQLEETEQPTEYVEGLSRALEIVNMRIPPDELACTGEDDQRAACNAYARVCKQTEAGCQGFRALAQPSLPEIPAVLSPRDICPSECVGYAEFRKQHSTFDLVHDLDPRIDDPEDDTIVPFVPSTASSCAVQDVGCERFTNLDAQALGGESESGFSFLRSCEKPGADSQTFYTWEGSDTTGYQLKTWSLKRDTTQSLPQPPKVIVKPGADGVLKDPNTCNQTSYLTAFDPDCRQFYDPEGNVFYRFESQTVLSSEKCVQLRKDGSDSADCTKTGGTFLPAGNQCLYLADQAQSNACDVANAGCREYIGTQGKVQEEILNEDFSSASSTAAKGANVTTFEQSDENILVGDKSQKIVVSGTNQGSIIFPLLVEPGALYELTFWARTLDPARPTITAKTTDQAITLASTQIEVEWRAYRVGPFTGTSGGVATTTQFTIGGFTKTTFLDKVRVARVEDRVYAIKDSWNTPASCDRTPEGIPQPQAMLGCQTYIDRKGTQVNARQFTRLCRDSAIGCTAFVNTRNSETPYQQSWTRNAIPSGNETTIREADRYDYYIDDQGKQCSAAQVGCRAFGLPQFNQDRLGLRSPAGANEGNTGDPFKTVYLKDDATKYDEGLCSERELFCESYSSVGGTDYFRAPADHACEYKKAIVIDEACNVPNTSGATFDGWFKTGTTCPCYPDRLMRGSEFGLRYAGDPGYNPWNGTDSVDYPDDGKEPDGVRAWAATCPDVQAECTEFRDVVDKSDQLHPLGRPYFVVKDQSLDTTSCNGQVDPARGCVLFRDMSDTRLLFSTDATSREYQTRAYQPVAPINCDNEPNRPACQGKVCQKYAFTNSAVAQLQENIDAVNEAEGSKSCTSDQDCALTTFPVVVDFATAVCGPLPNTTNLIVKVKPDRACSEWLSCASGETVYDPAEGKYKGICTDLKLCNKAGEPEGAGIPYCSNYVDRSLATELLKKDVVIDAGTYASRATGFGNKDYSGMTIPDHFQIVDAELAPIGSILAQDPLTRSRYKKDYRLAVPVPYPGPRARPANADEKEGLTISSELKDSLCVIDQTGGIGLLTDTSNNLKKIGGCSAASPCLCWVTVDQSQPPQLAGVGEPITSDNLNVVNLVTRFRQSTQPGLDPVLSRSFPNTQCKAAPQGDSPFGNEFVIEWDDTVTPPKPKRVADGYGSVKFCEYGEECACTYKRVEYGGLSKFYEPLSTNVSNAVCSGGPRDGLPCALDTGIQKSGQPAQTGGQTGGTPPAADSTTPSHSAQVPSTGGVPALPVVGGCGEGGTCTPVLKSTLVRGVTGQCLEYDTARVVAGDQTRLECLTWSPNPVLSGPGDTYHWSPTAGWSPPLSSGRYYCTSPVRPPRDFALKPEALVPNDEDASLLGAIAGVLEGFGIPSIPLSPVIGGYIGAAVTVGEDNEYTQYGAVGFKPNSAGTYAGAIRHFWYHDKFTSDKSCSTIFDPANVFGCDGNEPGASLDGGLAEGTVMGNWCELADDDQEPMRDPSVVRLVTTGFGANRSYAEYAVLLEPWHIAYGVNGGPLPDADAALENSLEDNIASFQFSVPGGKIGCMYYEGFGDAGGMEYDDPDSFGPQDNQWHANFRKYLAEGGGKLDRRNAAIVTEDGTPEGVPVKVKCANPANESDEEKSGCFMKTWELNYRAAGQERFQAFGPDIGRMSLDSLSKTPVYGRCDADHPWFSIRAVFEDTFKEENAKDPEDVTPSKLVGPFQLVGFWVTTCAPGDGPYYIYMNVNVSSADVCRELAETISKDSHESSVFTDRNSSRSGFAIPRSGFSWNSTNIPYGASLATGDAGNEPLFMTGVKQAESNPLHPPVFTFPGQTYFRPEKFPTSNWGMLSNVFARIYRIYGYFPRGTTRDSWACTDPKSPNFTGWCPTDADAEASRRYCGLEAKCVKGATGGGNAFAQKVCNSFSGTNRGLDCSNDSDICHVAPVQLDELSGTLRPQFAACERRQVADETWEKFTVGKNLRCTGAGCRTDGDCSTCKDTDTGCRRVTAVQCGAFRCSDTSVRGPSKVNDANGAYTSYCTSEKEESQECPLEVTGVKCVKPTASRDNGVRVAAAGSGVTGGGSRVTAALRIAVQNGDGDEPGDGGTPSGCDVGDQIDCSGDCSSGQTGLKTCLSNRTYGQCVCKDAPASGGAETTCLLGTTQNCNNECSSGQTGIKTCRANGTYSTCACTSGGAPGGGTPGGGGGTASNLGTCEGYPWAECTKDDDCSFTARNAWPAGIANQTFNWTTSNYGGQYSDKFARPTTPGSNPMYYYYTPGPFSDFSRGCWDGFCPLKDAFLPVKTVPAERTFFFATRVRYTADDTPIKGGWDDLDLLKTFPGFVPLVFSYYPDPGDGTSYGDISSNFSALELSALDGPPYMSWSWRGTPSERAKDFITIHYGACEPLAAMFRDGASTSSKGLGTCRGGARTGATCFADNDCRPPGMSGSDYDSFQTQSENWCNPVTTGAPDFAKSSKNSACWPSGASDADSNSPKREEDTRLDNNICTHPPGYWPRPNLCADPNDEYCGLFGYDLGNVRSSVDDATPLPTDVTPGLYTPKYLNSNTTDVKGNALDYNYIEYYNPAPPQIAAPDMRACTGGQCRVSGLGTIGLDGLNEGIVNGGAGGHVATLRFYAWASHEQMPLRRVTVDWGDGNQTELPDAFMKNRKPYCQTEKECMDAPGLTCESDADCPPGAVPCVAWGSCADRPNVRCFRDTQCESGGEPGTCNPRVAFGNTQEACDEQYFEFRHAYACLPNNKPASCDVNTERCSGNPQVECTIGCTPGDGNCCQKGDTCIRNLVPKGGCFDSGSNTCRFTPRVLITDNWGWCAGECRNEFSQSRILVDALGAEIRHPNGGCFDASRIKSNVDFKTAIGVNECSINYPDTSGTTGSSQRPWVVFPGSMQLLTGEAQ